MTALPLVSNRSSQDTLAWTADGPISVERYCADVQALAAWLPRGRWILNLCEDRYNYAVLMGACAVSDRISLQPSSRSSQVLQWLLAQYEGSRIVTDISMESDSMPKTLHMPDLARLPHAVAAAAMPRIDAERTVAVLFTSGTTGQATPHAKTWGKLVANGQAEATALELTSRPHVLVGTVPAQHSYGFESTFLLALHGGCSFWAGRPFYPQDLAVALTRVPQPRMVVTTPYHLAHIIDSGVALPAVDAWLSATAPLSETLARRVEAATDAPVYEIYGSTESSQLATRRTTDGPGWSLMPGVELAQEDGTTWAFGLHVEGRVALSDHIQLHADGRFTLLGRHADMVNVVGKRTSLAYLEHQLRDVEGVLDAAFFLPPQADAGRIVRLAAFVVAPDRTPEQLRTGLRQRIDPAFMPRPLVLLDHLPRNSTGKLTRDTLHGLYVQWTSRHGRDSS